MIEEAESKGDGVLAGIKRSLGVTEQPSAREARTKAKPFLGSEKSRMDDRIGHIAEAMVDRERRGLKSSGIDVSLGEDGYYHMAVDGEDFGYFDDVVERTSDSGRAAYERLDDGKKAALEVIETNNAELNGTMQFHGAEPRIDPDIEGAYFGRRVTGKQYEGMGGTVRLDKLQGTEQSRKVGADRIKSRTIQNIEELEKRGYTTENPWVARLAIARGKLMTAEDAYLAKSLKPLRVKNAGSGFGYQQVTGHPAFNSQWYEEPVAKAIQKGLDPRRKIPGFERVNSVLTPLRASFDSSSALQQGLRFWLTNPKDGASYWLASARSLGDGKIYDGVLNKLDGDGPGIIYHTENGLRFTGEAAPDEMMFGKITGAGPVGKVADKAFQKSNQLFSRPLNAYRVHMANAAYKRLEASGLKGAELDEAMLLTNRGINRMFGWSDSRPTTVEQAAVFAPRYFRASLETLGAAVSNRGIEGQLARRHMGLMLAEGALVTWLVNESRGYETEFSPTSSNFLRMRNVGGLDVSPFGTYASLMKVLAQTASGGDEYASGGNPLKDRANALKRFIWGKMSPGLKLLYEPTVEGSTFLGEPLDPLGDPLGFLYEEGKSSLPFGLQNLLEEGPLAAAVGSVGVTNAPVTPAEKRDLARSGNRGGINLPVVGNIETTGRRTTGAAQEQFGAEYEELSGAEKSIVNEDPRVRRHQKEATRNTLTKAGERGDYARRKEELRGQLEALTGELESGEITGDQFRDQYGKVSQGLRDARRDFGISGGGDKEITGWFALYDKATTDSGRLDGGLLERLQAQYSRAHPEIEAKILREIGANDNAVMREYREARRQADEYYSIPAYRGMSLEDSREAGAILAAASDMVRFGQARSRDHALRLLSESDPEAVRLARRAARVGANPVRKGWRRDPAHAAFGRFYSSIAAPTAA